MGGGDGRVVIERLKFGRGGGTPCRGLELGPPLKWGLCERRLGTVAVIEQSVSQLRSEGIMMFLMGVMYSNNTRIVHFFHAEESRIRRLWCLSGHRSPAASNSS